MQRFRYSGYFTWTFLGIGAGWLVIALMKFVGKEPVAWIAVYAVSGVAFVFIFIIYKRTACIEWDEAGITGYFCLGVKKRKIRWTDVSDVKHSRFLETLTLLSSGKDKVPIRFRDVSSQDRAKMGKMILEVLEKYSSPEVHQKAKAFLSKS